MITRQLVLRQGRRALPRAALPPLRRWLSTIDSIEHSTQNSTQQIHSLETQLSSPNNLPHVPSVEPQSQTAEASLAPQSLAERYYALREQKKQFEAIGSDIGPHYQPHTLLNHPPSVADVTLELLLASEAHQGHATSLWNPANARFIHGVRQGIHIISLELTAAHLRRAAKVVSEVSRVGGIVLFVGTRQGQETTVVKAAQLAKGYHLFERWIPGSITNGQQILGRCKTKVLNDKDEELSGFDEQLYDRPVLRPDLVVCLNPMENYVLLHECALNEIPTIGVIDTNADPTWVTYPIPANDDSLRCIQVIAGVLGRAGGSGQKKRLEAAERGIVTYKPDNDLELPEQLEENKSEPELEDEDPTQSQITRTDEQSSKEKISEPSEESRASIESVTPKGDASVSQIETKSKVRTPDLAKRETASDEASQVGSKAQAEPQEIPAQPSAASIKINTDSSSAAEPQIPPRKADLAQLGKALSQLSSRTLERNAELQTLLTQIEARSMQPSSSLNSTTEVSSSSPSSQPQEIVIEETPSNEPEPQPQLSDTEIPPEQQVQAVLTDKKGIEHADEMEAKLEEVANRERKSGRDIKKVS